MAEVFGKQHKNVMQAIWRLECSPEFQGLNFQLVEIIEKNGIGADVNKSYYEIARDGFMILVMGFTGKKAMQFKEAFKGLRSGYTGVAWRVSAAS